MRKKLADMLVVVLLSTIVISALTLPVLSSSLVGDVDNDEDVDSDDVFTYFSPAYGSQFGDPNYDPRCDFDNDSYVDVMDVFMLVPNYGKGVENATAELGSAEGTLDLFDAVDYDHSVDWTLGSEPGTYPFFDVKLMLTNITSAYAVAFSVEYDPSILNYSSHSWGDCMDASGKLTLPLPLPIDYANGWIKQGAIGHLSPDVGVSYTDPNWGWVATLRFEFVGTSPSVTSPVDTYINLTYIEATHKTGWYKVDDYLRRPFVYIGQCRFHYVAPPIIIKPAAVFVITDPPPYYLCNNITFDASASIGGIDGDSSTAITELHWDWGDTTSEVCKGGNFSWTAKHHYNITGLVTICLTVVAPAVGWSDPTYINTSDPSCVDITIQFEPTPVGGINIPVNKLALLAPYIGLTILLAVAVVTVVYVKKRKRHTETFS